MPWWQRIRTRGALDRQLEAELRDHIDRLTADYVAAGMPEAEAGRRARLDFGGVEQTKEACRDVRGVRLLEDAAQDVRYGLRGLARDRRFAGVAILTLALGIGATTATFSLVNAVLLEPSPYSNADRLVQIVEHVPAEESFSGRPVRMPAMNVAEVDWWRENARTLSHLAVTMPDTRTVAWSDGTIRLTGARVSPALFAMRNVPPVLGRPLRPGDERADARVVVISAETWRRLYGGSPGVVGQSMALDGQPHTIVGVMPSAFGDAAFWIPFVVAPRPGAVEVVQVTAMLGDGVSLAAAEAEIQSLGTRLRGGVAEPGGLPRFELVRMRDEEVRAVRPALLVLAAGVAIVLLIVCANVANLLLVRGAGRHLEIGIRRALGAPTGRLVRQLLAESLVLSLAGGAAGAGLAYGGVTFVRAASVIEIPEQFRLALGPLGTTILPRAGEASIEWGILAFAFAVALVAGTLSGLAPALRLARVADGGRGRRMGVSRTSSRARGLRAHGHASAPANRAGELLGTVQIGLATTLLIAGGLLVHSFVRLSTVTLGFDPAAQVFQLVTPGEYSRARRLALAYEAAERMRALPGVEAAGFINLPPFTEQNVFRNFYLPADWEDRRDVLGDEDRTLIRGTSPGYLRGIGARLLEGRWLDDRDDASPSRVMLVSRGWARRFSPERSPVGTTVSFVTAGRERRRISWEIVGVVDDIRWQMNGPTELRTGSDFPLMGFVSLQQLVAASLGTRDLEHQPNMELDMLIGEPGGVTFALRTNGAPLPLAAVRDAIREIDSAATVDGFTTMGGVAGALIGRPRFYAVVMSAFGIIAALVAAIGVYGVLAHATTRRTREFGVRLALGATPAALVRLAIGRGVVLVGAGIALGVAGALGLTRYLAGMLFGLTSVDAPTYVSVAIGFALIALLACYVPARRATKVDPLAALRVGD